MRIILFLIIISGFIIGWNLSWSTLSALLKVDCSIITLKCEDARGTRNH